MIWTALRVRAGLWTLESLDKVSKKSPQSLEKVKRSRKDFFETFSRLAGGSGAGGPGRLFPDSFWETPVNGQQVPNFDPFDFSSVSNLSSFPCLQA